MSHNRFIRNEMLVGKDGLKKLASATVTIAGLGAVGSFAVEALARCGIGRLKIVDFDIVKESNFNRQLLALESNLGKLKIKVAEKRILDINPACNVEALELFIHQDSIDDLLSRQTDVLIDAIDSLGPKITLISETVKRKIPIISSMGAAMKFNPFLIRAADISQTSICPLAKQIRKKLKRLDIEKGVTCVFSTEQVKGLSREYNSELNEVEYYERGRKRTPLGSMPYITGIFGLICAAEAVKVILKDRS